MKLREILEEEKIPTDELKKTTVTLPQLMRIALQDIRERHKLSWQEVSRRTIEHGFSLLEHKYNKIIVEIYEKRRELRYPEVRKIRNYMVDAKVTIDGLEKVARKGVNVRSNIFGGISNMAEKLSLEVSSMLRLCIYYSLVTSDELPDEVINEAKKQIENFKFELLWTNVVLMGYVVSEKLWQENKERWIKELEENED